MQNGKNRAIFDAHISKKTTKNDVWTCFVWIPCLLELLVEQCYKKSVFWHRRKRHRSAATQVDQCIDFHSFLSIYSNVKIVSAGSICGYSLAFLKTARKTDFWHSERTVPYVVHYFECFRVILTFLAHEKKQIEHSNKIMKYINLSWMLDYALYCMLYADSTYSIPDKKKFKVQAKLVHYFGSIACIGLKLNQDLIVIWHEALFHIIMKYTSPFKFKSGHAVLTISPSVCLSLLGLIIYEPQREKTNNVDSDQVWHKPGCTATGDG